MRCNPAMTARLLGEDSVGDNPRMCMACEYPLTATSWSEIGAKNARERQQARFRCTQVLNNVLPAYGLKAQGGGMSPGIQISTGRGDLALALDFDDVWALADRMIGRKIDPLDAGFIRGGETAA
jgi:hypothetical protein